MLDLLSMIHKENPYDGFNYEKYPVAIDGWYSESPVFAEIIGELKPALIVELGTWKGASAIYMAEQLRQRGLDRARILCVDTWLGSVDFWTDHDDPEKYLALQTVNGYPTVYYQFLANVMHKNLQDYIIPFPQTTLEAWRWLCINGIKADFIYVDASHNRDDVYNDIHHYWKILHINGKICGDDYDEYWPTVKTAVNCFVEENSLELTIDGNKWIIEKKTEFVRENSDKSVQRQLNELYNDLQIVQHDYLQYQKTHCRMRDEYVALQAEHAALQAEFNVIQEDYANLSQAKVVRLTRALGKYPIFVKLSELIDTCMRPRGKGGA